MIKKTLFIFILILVLLANCANSYYRFENTFNAFNLTRNKNLANMIISYSNLNPTNQDVEMNVDFDKVISIIGEDGGVTLSNDGKHISKLFTENEANSLLIRDEDYNYQTLDFNVNWIDKVPPVITGAENGKTYNSNINLNYSDNVEIKEIYADYYSNSFYIYTESYDFCEQNRVRILNANRNTIVAYVLSNTKEIEKYNYYIDGELKATTHDKQYKFTNLEYSEAEHHIVVEGLDRYGNVVASQSVNRKTLPIGGVTMGYDGSREYISVYGVPQNLINITTYIWCWGRADSMRTITPTQNAPNSYIVAVDRINHNNYTGQYIVKFEMKYIENGVSKTSNIIGYVYMPSNFKATDYSGLPNSFSENGNYYVRCTDTAGNETELDFVIRK